MSQVHFLVWITVFSCEISQLFKSHACTPKRHICTLVIKSYDLLIEKLCEIIVVSVTSRQEDPIDFLKNTVDLRRKHGRDERDDTGTGSL